MEGLQIKEKEASSEETLKAHFMNYWLEKISDADMMKLWRLLQAGARDARPRISLEIMASGTMLSRDYRAVVTAPTTGDGFVLTFTVSDTCK